MRILAVDDDPESLYMIRALFQGNGFEVVSARNGREAVDRARADAPDLIVSDILMPEMDGYQLCREVRADEALSGIPFLFYTATYTDRKDREFAMSLGADAFLVKPMEPEELLRAVRGAVSGRKPSPRDDGQLSPGEREFLRRHNEALFRKLEKKIAELETASAKIRADDARLESLLRMAQAGYVSTREVLERAVREALVLCGGRFGAVFLRGRTDGELALACCCRDDMGTCTAEKLPPGLLPERCGLWEEAVLRGTSLIRNDFRPGEAGGAPSAPERLLVVPVVRGGAVAAVVGLAGKPSDYGEWDARQLALLMESAWTLAERMQMERNIRESETRFSDLLEGISLAMLIVSPGGTVTFCNPFLLGLTSRSPHETVERNWLDLFVPASQQARHAEVIDEVYRTGRPQTFDGEVVARGRSNRMITWNACALRDSEGSIDAIALVGVDVTDHRETEEQLRQSQKMEALGTMAGGVAHDFNNILTVILSCASLLKPGMEKGSKNEALVGEIVTSVERASQMTRSLLAFGRKQATNLAPCDLNEVLVGLEKSLKRLIREDIDFRVSRHERPVPGLLDRGQIEQLIVNLAVNARDAMPGGGALSIGTSEVEVLPGKEGDPRSEVPPGRYGVLTVSDTGVGMDAETLRRVFEPFFTTKGPEKGTGLGLSIVYGIVTRHGGHIRVSSRKGRGTTFRVYLPILPEGVDLLAAPAEAMVPRGKGTILVVEDEEAVRKVIGIILEGNGYRVLHARNGEDGLAVFRNHREGIALVVSDLVMPRMNGRPMCAEIRRMKSDVPVIFLSGYPDGQAFDAAGGDPATIFLPKPLKPSELLRTAHGLIERAGKREPVSGRSS